jgi:phenylalanyl-tRNA synthetase alpha chain
VEGLTLKELEGVIGDKNVVKLGHSKGFRSKLIAKGKEGRFVATSVSAQSHKVPESIRLTIPDELNTR